MNRRPASYTFSNGSPAETNNRNNFKQNLREWSRVSTTHGVRYAVNPEAGLVERLVWIGMVICALVYAIFGSTSVYIAWQSDPVLTTIGTASKDITSLEFPAITLCKEGNDIRSLAKLPKLLPPADWFAYLRTINIDSLEFDLLSEVEQKEHITGFISSQVIKSH